MRAPLRAVLMATIAGFLALRALGAQGVTVARPLAATHPQERVGEPGTSVTSAIRVSNLSADTLSVTPRIIVPVEWSVLLGAAPFILAPGEGDSWLVSVRVPAHAVAGRYPIIVRAIDASQRMLMNDSIVVTIRPRHAVEVIVAERPVYAVSGTQFRGAFIVQNKGNVGTTLALHATSLLGGRLDAPRSVTLNAGESKLIHVASTAVLDGQEARDEVLELRATDVADTAAVAVATMRLTVVQRAGASERLHTVASTLRLRASDATTGVSPFELTGGGRLRDGGSDELEFVLRGKAGEASPFGDREEYRVGIRSETYRVQAGDAIFLASPLSNSGQRGFGGGFDLGDERLGGGAYAQSFRFQPERGTEQGAFVRVGVGGERDGAGGSRLGLSAVNRRGGELAAKVLGASVKLRPIGNLVVDLEYADSRGAGGHGAARSARLSGGDAVQFDLTHLAADPTFAGAARGARYDVISVNTQSWRALQLNASAATTRNSSPVGLAPSSQTSNSALLELSYDSHYSLAYSAYARASTGLVIKNESQRGLVARVNRTVGKAQLWSTAEGGRLSDPLGASTHGYHQFTLGASALLGAHNVSVFGETSEGASITQGPDRMVTFGFDAQMLIAPTTTLGLGGSSSRTFIPDGGAAQMDARLAHALPNGAKVSLRVRLGGHSIREAAAGHKLAYLEYSMPLALPVGHSRAPGRVRGRVVDQQTGRGVSGALVRLGPQAAITDDDGGVAFAGLPAGAYRLSLARQLASGSSIFSDDPNVTVDSTRRDPATFRVSVEPAGTVSGNVRKMIVARTGIGSAPDSLVDGGPLEGVSIALAGGRDTLYRSTDAAGVFHFTDIPSGSWTVIVMTEAGAQLQWELRTIPVVMRTGEKPTVTFKLVPRQRKVRIISGDGIDEEKPK